MEEDALEVLRLWAREAKNLGSVAFSTSVVITVLSVHFGAVWPCPHHTKAIHIQLEISINPDVLSLEKLQSTIM